MLVSLENPSIKNTQEMASFGEESYESELPKNEFLTIDVDGHCAAVKDMRELTADSDPTELEVFIVRGGKEIELGRRRLTHLHHKDKIIIRQGDDAPLELDYRYDHEIRVAHAVAAEQVSTDQRSESASQNRYSSIPDASARRSSLKSLSDQLITQPEYHSERTNEVDNAMEVEELNDEPLASQYVPEISKGGAQIPAETHHSSDDETVDPEDDGSKRADELLDDKAIDVGVESDATSIFSPPPESMGETQPPSHPSSRRLLDVSVSNVAENYSEGVGAARAADETGGSRSDHADDEEPKATTKLQLSHVTSPVLEDRFDSDAETEEGTPLKAKPEAAKESAATENACVADIVANGGRNAQNSSPASTDKHHDEVFNAAEKAKDDAHDHLETANDDDDEPEPETTTKPPAVPLIQALIEATKSTVPRKSNYRIDQSSTTQSTYGSQLGESQRAGAFDFYDDGYEEDTDNAATNEPESAIAAKHSLDSHIASADAPDLPEETIPISVELAVKNGAGDGRASPEHETKGDVASNMQALTEEQAPVQGNDGESAHSDNEAESKKTRQTSQTSATSVSGRKNARTAKLETPPATKATRKRKETSNTRVAGNSVESTTRSAVKRMRKAHPDEEAEPSEIRVLTTKIQLTDKHKKVRLACLFVIVARAVDILTDSAVVHR
jgi:hypothetical protein